MVSPALELILAEVFAPWGALVLADRAYDSNPLRNELGGDGLYSVPYRSTTLG